MGEGSNKAPCPSEEPEQAVIIIAAAASWLYAPVIMKSIVSSTCILTTVRAMNEHLQNHIGSNNHPRIKLKLHNEPENEQIINLEFCQFVTVKLTFP